MTNNTVISCTGSLNLLSLLTSISQAYADAHVADFRMDFSLHDS